MITCWVAFTVLSVNIPEFKAVSFAQRGSNYIVAPTLKIFFFLGSAPVRVWRRQDDGQGREELGGGGLHEPRGHEQGGCGSLCQKDGTTETLFCRCLELKVSA